MDVGHPVGPGQVIVSQGRMRTTGRIHPFRLRWGSVWGCRVIPSDPRLPRPARAVLVNDTATGEAWRAFLRIHLEMLAEIGHAIHAWRSGRFYGDEAPLTAREMLTW